MGTRADFYVGRGRQALWLGSVAMDGRDPEFFRGAITEAIFRTRVDEWMTQVDHSTYPPDGWPWPWEDSCLTDVSYAFDGVLWMTSFGDYDGKYPRCSQCREHVRTWVDLHEYLVISDRLRNESKIADGLRHDFVDDNIRALGREEAWRQAHEKYPDPDWDERDELTSGEVATFPLRGGAVDGFTLGKRSGVLIVGG